MERLVAAGVEAQGLLRTHDCRDLAGRLQRAVVRLGSTAKDGQSEKCTQEDTREGIGKIISWRKPAVLLVDVDL